MAKKKNSSSKLSNSSADKKKKTSAEIQAMIDDLEKERDKVEQQEQEAAAPKLTERQIREKKEQDELYEKHKREIDLELKRCTGHLRKLDSQVAQEAIRRLKMYYLSYGLPMLKE
ncbi:MAG TPA: hypothetical protein VN641_18495 [Urbifossiella sp.]|nr:hypothetical protein [Urbifossiella sp.]